MKLQACAAHRSVVWPVARSNAALDGVSAAICGQLVSPSIASLNQMTRAQSPAVHGLITARPAALNALVSRDATANPCAAAIAAI